jgi:hypothetical protein
MIDVKQKTFWEEVSKLLRDWAKGGYNQDWCDFWTKLNHLKKQHKDYCKDCPFKVALEDNIDIFKDS